MKLPTKTPIVSRLAELNPTGAMVAHGLAVVPILGPTREGADYALLDRDSASGVKVTEVDDAGRVNTLHVCNTLATMLFLLDGQELIGAKQNRILNADVLVPAASEMDIPVSCVEHGRWSRVSASFAAGRCHPKSAQQKKLARVHEALRAGRGHDADQGAVWDDVHETLRATAAPSETDALHAAYVAHEDTLKGLRAGFTVPGDVTRPDDITMPDDAVGVALVAGDRLVSLDVFDRASTLKRCWDLIRDSFLIEYVARATETLEVDPKAACVLASRALDQAQGTKWDKFQAVGAGRDLRFKSKDLVGAALVTDDDCVVHLQVFGTDV